MAKHGDALKINELSGYLQISNLTFYKLVRESKIPCQKVGCYWRFRKEAFDYWLEESMDKKEQ